MVGPVCTIRPPNRWIARVYAEPMVIAPVAVIQRVNGQRGMDLVVARGSTPDVIARYIELTCVVDANSWTSQENQRSVMLFVLITERLIRSRR